MKPWAVALGASVALHGAALVVLAPTAHEATSVHEAARPRPVTFTRVSLARGAKAEPTPATGDAPPAAPRLRPAPPRAASVEPRAAASGPTTPEPEAVGGPEAHDGAPTVVAGSGEGAPDGGGGGSSGSEPSADAASSVGPATSGEAPAAELLALMHARLAAVADGCYPATARRFKQRGTVQLSFCADERGGAREIRVTESSGAELLDAAARTCVVERAAPFPAEAARRCFTVPVRFGAR